MATSPLSKLDWHSLSRFDRREQIAAQSTFCKVLMSGTLFQFNFEHTIHPKDGDTPRNAFDLLTKSRLKQLTKNHLEGVSFIMKVVREKVDLPVARPACWHNPLRDRDSDSSQIPRHLKLDYRTLPQRILGFLRVFSGFRSRQRTFKGGNCRVNFLLTFVDVYMFQPVPIDLRKCVYLLSTLGHFFVSRVSRSGWSGFIFGRSLLRFGCCSSPNKSSMGHHQKYPPKTYPPYRGSG